MKRILSLALSAAMVLSSTPMAYANDDWKQGTKVEYVANSDANRWYTITVPAKMTPKLNQEVEGTVTLKGQWSSDEVIVVTADTEVTLTNSINANDTHTLGITLTKMEYEGNNTEETTHTGTITLAAMPEAALFGTWSGKFNYNVDISTGAVAESPILYNVWYTFQNTGIETALLFKEDNFALSTTTFVDGNESGLVPTFHSYGYTADGDILNIANVGDFEISADKKVLTLVEDNTVSLTTNGIVDNTDYKYCYYNDETTGLFFLGGETWAEFCTRTNFLWHVDEQGYVYDNDFEEPYYVMNADRSCVKGTDLMIEDALYLCDKPTG